MTDTWYIARFTAQKMALAAQRLRAMGYTVWIPTETFKVWVHNRKALKDRPVLDRYIFVAGTQPWTIPYAPGVECLILDADGNPAQVPDRLLERFRTKAGEKPKLNPAWAIPEGKTVEVDYKTYRGMATVARTGPGDRRKGLLWVDPLGGSIGSVQVPVAAVGAID